jgi:hypothetical protein
VPLPRQPQPDLPCPAGASQESHPPPLPHSQQGSNLIVASQRTAPRSAPGCVPQLANQASKSCLPGPLSRTGSLTLEPAALQLHAAPRDELRMSAAAAAGSAAEVPHPARHSGSVPAVVAAARPPPPSQGQSSPTSP